MQKAAFPQPSVAQLLTAGTWCRRSFFSLELDWMTLHGIMEDVENGAQVPIVGVSDGV